ncbi:MAG: arylsulfatase A-like enzyme [Kiritimatiellia bacterium]|jgi:arylsulfatase A-like enzyme
MRYLYMLFSLFVLTTHAAVKPNILFIFSDDHAYQAISAYGHGLNETPNIDRIAKEGVRFNRCYVSNAICGPMRAVIQTGKYSHLNGFLINGNKFDGNQWTFPKELQKVGYQTAVIGKWHLGTHMEPKGFNYSEVLIDQGPYYNPPMLRDEKGDGNRVKKQYTGYTTEIITDLALEWLKNQRDQEKPFMLMYQHKAPHRNWEPGPDYLHLYDDVTFPEPESLFDDYTHRADPARDQDMSISKTMTRRDLKLDPPRNFTPEQLATWNAAYEPKNKAFEAMKLEGRELISWKFQRYIKDYLRCIAAVDHEVGKVLDYLDKSGLAKNTIVIYCSDQGFYLGEHGWFDKRWMYEESFRTPFLVRWPDVVAPGLVNETDIVSPVDFAATFLEIAGAANPGDLQGKSLIPILKGQTPRDWRKSFYYHYYEGGGHGVARHYGVSNGRYKLINYYQDHVKQWELFDLKSDPQEMRSQYENPEYAKVKEDMFQELQRLRVELKLPDEDPEASFGGWGDRTLELRKMASAANVPLTEVLRMQAVGVVKNKKPDPSFKPITVGAWISTERSDGVILAQGGGGMGYACYLKDGYLVFGIKNGGSLSEVKSKAKIPMKTRTHVRATLDAELKLTLFVNGKPAGIGKGRFVSGIPNEGLDVGEDSGSLVGNYTDDNVFKGTMSDIRIYWGRLEQKELDAWAHR